MFVIDFSLYLFNLANAFLKLFVMVEQNRYMIGCKGTSCTELERTETPPKKELNISNTAKKSIKKKAENAAQAMKVEGHTNSRQIKKMKVSKQEVE